MPDTLATERGPEQPSDDPWVLIEAIRFAMAPRRAEMPEFPNLPAGQALPGGGWISGPCTQALP